LDAVKRNNQPDQTIHMTNARKGIKNKKGDKDMKTLKTTIAAMMIMLTSLAASAQPMSVYAMRNNARFLTDRMAYTLGLSAALLDDLYYINYDYICGVNDYLDAVALGYRYDDYMEIVYARDYALRRLLTERQWARLMTYNYFYRPITFKDHRWSFSIYLYDRRMNHYFFSAPRRFNDYRGGTFFGGMRRIDVPGNPMNMGNGMRPGPMIGSPAPNNVQSGNNRLGDNRMGDMRGEVIRQGAVGNNQPYHFEDVTPNRGFIGSSNNGQNSRTQSSFSVPNDARNSTRTQTVRNSYTITTTTMPNTDAGRNVSRNTNTRTSAASTTIRQGNTTPTRTVTSPTVNRNVRNTVTSFPNSSSSRTSGQSATRSGSLLNTSIRTTTSTANRSAISTSTSRTTTSSTGSRTIGAGRR